MYTQQIRPAAVAGSFYPGAAPQLQKMLEVFLSTATPLALSPIYALIAPHAGYIYSGPIAAFGYKLLSQQPQPPRRIYLLGPAHRVWFQGVALGAYDAFNTPLGAAPVDRDAMDRLSAASPLFTQQSQSHTGEHCLEVQIPFLQTVLPDVPIVPMLFGDVDPLAVGQALNTQLEPGDLIVVSSDLSHYHNYNAACHLDKTFVEAVLQGDRAKTARGEACGQAPILALMTIAQAHAWQPHLLDYRNSGDTAGDKAHVVGYAAIAYTQAETG